MPNSKAKEPSPGKAPVLDPSLLAKARQLGIESSFTDNQGTVHAASAATLEKIASLLETGKRQIEPVEVVWLETTEEEVSIPVRTQGYPPFTVHFILESGSVRDAPVEDTGGRLDPPWQCRSRQASCRDPPSGDCPRSLPCDRRPGPSRPAWEGDAPTGTHKHLSPRGFPRDFPPPSRGPLGKKLWHWGLWRSEESVPLGKGQTNGPGGNAAAVGILS